MIRPPLAPMRARHFADQIDVLPLPFHPLARTIALTARRDNLRSMPSEVGHRTDPFYRMLS